MPPRNRRAVSTLFGAPALGALHPFGCAEGREVRRVEGRSKRGGGLPAEATKNPKNLSSGDAAAAHGPRGHAGHTRPAFSYPDFTVGPGVAPDPAPPSSSCQGRSARGLYRRSGIGPCGPHPAPKARSGPILPPGLPSEQVSRPAWHVQFGRSPRSSRCGLGDSDSNPPALSASFRGRDRAPITAVSCPARAGTQVTSIPRCRAPLVAPFASAAGRRSRRPLGLCISGTLSPAVNSSGLR
jgi:hypothetical protein